MHHDAHTFKTTGAVDEVSRSVICSVDAEGSSETLEMSDEGDEHAAMTRASARVTGTMRRGTCRRLGKAPAKRSGDRQTESGLPLRARRPCNLAR